MSTTVATDRGKQSFTRTTRLYCIFLVTSSISPKIIEGESFQRNGGAASVGEYKRVI